MPGIIALLTYHAIKNYINNKHEIVNFMKNAWACGSQRIMKIYHTPLKPYCREKVRVGELSYVWREGTGERDFQTKNMLVLTIVCFFTLITSAIAEETQPQSHHGHAAASEISHYVISPEMLKQHKTMSDINKAWTEIKLYAQSGSFDRVAKSADAMLQSTDYLPKFMLHKNADQMDDFLQAGSLLKKNLQNMKEACNSQKDDMVKNALSSIEESCKNCHSKFR